MVEIVKFSELKLGDKGEITKTITEEDVKRINIMVKSSVRVVVGAGVIISLMIFVCLTDPGSIIMLLRTGI